METQKKYNNIALCYHGIVNSRQSTSAYRTYTKDFKGQINYLKRLGYTFVTPTKYYEWYTGKYSVSTPIAAVIFDDALESINQVTPWLISNKIPFGIAVIGRKLRKHLPEDDFLSWDALKTICDSGLCEILSHTYNLHHTALMLEENQVISDPITECPCYLDNGEFIYLSTDNKLWYWDFKHIDDISWAFPIIGTDTKTKQCITSTVTFKSKTDVTADRLRLWASLHNPYGSGYSVSLKIYINNNLVSSTTVQPTNYGTISQWPEMEFITIPFDTSFEIESGKSYTVKFVTQNAGNAALRIYSIPDFSGNFAMTSTCTTETFPNSEEWPAKACMILADSKGSSVTDEAFKDYILKDMEENNSVIRRYFGAVWTPNSTGYADTDPLECLVLGGTYSDGTKADTTIKFHAESSFTGEVLRFKYVSHLGTTYPLIVNVYINENKAAQFAPNWNDWNWQEIDIGPFSFSAGEDYIIRFETINANPTGFGLIRIYMNQPDLPKMVWDSSASTWTVPPESSFVHESLYQVSNIEGTDVYPDGVKITDPDYSWTYNIPYDGPGKAFIEILACSENNSNTPSQICYPFSSYYSSVVSNIEDLQTSMKSAVISSGISSGFTVWDDNLKDYKTAQKKYSQYLIPRYSITGNATQVATLKDFKTITQK